MNMLSIAFGFRINAKRRRAKKGMEKRWNKHDEPLSKYLGRYMQGRNKRRLQYDKRKHGYIA